MRIFGTLLQGGTAYELAANQKLTAKFTVAEEGTVSALSIWADGGGSGVGTQPLRAVIYDDAGSLVAAGDEIAVDAGAELGRISAPFVGAHPGGVTLAPGDYQFGVHGGSPGGVVRLYGDASAVSGLVGTDAYSDGPSDPFGVPDDEPARDLSLFAPWFAPWVPPLNETEEWFGRLPFGRAEDVFLVQSGVERTSVECTWHGSVFDPETGAFAVVRDDGPLAGLVGQRLLVTAGSKKVAVFVHSQGQVFEADLSLTRRAFAAISGLAVGTSIPVTVEVIPA